MEVTGVVQVVSPFALFVQIMSTLMLVLIFIVVLKFIFLFLMKK